MYEVEYEGSWEVGIRQGWGVRYYSTGEMYQGEFSGGKRHGVGMMHFLNGDMYYGEWNLDWRLGQGVVYTADGNCFSGRFVKGKKQGTIMLTQHIMQVCSPNQLKYLFYF